MDYSITKIADLAMALGQALQQKNGMLTTAESCTGGLLSEQITAVAGSSAWFTCGFVTYSNASKIQLLGVSQNTLNLYGAVSEETATEMALGALKKCDANISVSITGIAGPSGGSPEKPVGTVCFAWATLDHQLMASTQCFQGNRQQIREQAAHFAMTGLLKLMNA